MADLSIQIQCDAWAQPMNDPAALAVRAARAALDAGAPESAPAPGELTVVLADDAFVQNLNRHYRGQDEPTNVLSFSAVTPEIEGAPALLGDIVLAFETARREAAEQGKSVSDHASHLIVHGVLHLLGFDHESGSQAQDMESLERQILSGLGISDPYEVEVLTLTGAANG